MLESAGVRSATGVLITTRDDDVLSYASTGATAIWSNFRGNDTLVVAEALDVFRAPVPLSMRGKILADSNLLAATGRNVVAIDVEGVLVGNPNGDVMLGSNTSLVLIGGAAVQARLAGVNEGRGTKLRRCRG